MREKTCCFTGHRIIRTDQIDIVSTRTENTIRELIAGQDIRFFRVGGAQGYDTMAANILFRLRATDFPDIQIILVYPFDGFTSRWTDAQRAAYNRLLPLYDKCICVSPEGSRKAFLARDRHLPLLHLHCLLHQEPRRNGLHHPLCAKSGDPCSQHSL